MKVVAVGAAAVDRFLAGAKPADAAGACRRGD
jgi:hypothetical protein